MASKKALAQRQEKALETQDQKLDAILEKLENLETMIANQRPVETPKPEADSAEKAKPAGKR